MFNLGIVNVGWPIRCDVNRVEVKVWFSGGLAILYRESPKDPWAVVSTDF